MIKKEELLKGIRSPKIPCRKCLNDLEARRETEGYVLLYCPHNRAGLITSAEKSGEEPLDVAISPVNEKQFRNMVVSVLLNNALRESRRADQILDSFKMGRRAGSA